MSPKFLITTQSYRHEYDDTIEVPTQFAYLLETDFNGHQRVLSIPTPTDSPYGERIKPGLRGLSIREKKIYVANWNTIHVVDQESLEMIDTFSHPLMADLHGVHADGQQKRWAAMPLLFYAIRAKPWCLFSLDSIRYQPSLLGLLPGLRKVVAIAGKGDSSRGGADD